MRFFADGVPLMDGDYVSRTPEVLVQLAAVSGVRQGQERMNLFIDNALVVPGVQGSGRRMPSQAAIAGDGALFLPRACRRSARTDRPVVPVEWRVGDRLDRTADLR